MLNRLRTVFDHWHRIREIRALGPRELEDLGMTRGQAERLVTMSEDVPARIATMAAAFGLAEADIQRAYTDYLELLETCDTCGHKPACAKAMKSTGDLRNAAVDFCPNAEAYAKLAQTRTH